MSFNRLAVGAITFNVSMTEFFGGACSGAPIFLLKHNQSFLPARRLEISFLCREPVALWWRPSRGRWASAQMSAPELQSGLICGDHPFDWTIRTAARRALTGAAFQSARSSVIHSSSVARR